MAGQVAAADFGLPELVPYYGPGPAPFAYPPLGIYAMGVALKLGIHPLSYLRWMPALFSLCAVVPLCLLCGRFTRSMAAVLCATILVSASPSAYTAHTLSAGVVRALAFGFMLWAMYFFLMAVEIGDSRRGVVAGIFLGLTALTHLFYGLVSGVWALANLLANPRRVTWAVAAATGALAALVIAPWVATVLARYGQGILAGAWRSHHNTDFMQLLLSPDGLQSWLWSNLAPLRKDSLLLLSLVLGIAFLLSRRRYGLPLALAAGVWIFAEGERFIVTMSAMAAAASVELRPAWLGRYRWSTLAVHALLAAATWTSAMRGLAHISGISPTLHESTFELGQFIQRNSSPQGTYLFVGNQDEAEWLPYVLRREPVYSKWGSEWLGTYYDESRRLMDVMHCQSLQNLACIEELLVRTGSPPPDILITRKGDDSFTNQLRESGAWELAGEVGRYLVWVIPGASRER
jgi:hypothetical protein